MSGVALFHRFSRAPKNKIGGFTALKWSWNLGWKRVVWSAMSMCQSRRQGRQSSQDNGLTGHYEDPCSKFPSCRKSFPVGCMKVSEYLKTCYDVSTTYMWFEHFWLLGPMRRVRRLWKAHTEVENSLWTIWHTWYDPLVFSNILPAKFSKHKKLHTLLSGLHSVSQHLQEVMEMVKFVCWTHMEGKDLPLGDIMHLERPPECVFEGFWIEDEVLSSLHFEGIRGFDLPSVENCLVILVCDGFQMAGIRELHQWVRLNQSGQG